jgi:hypothetical protein
MKTCSKFPLLGEKSAARIFLGQYLSIQPGDLAAPRLGGRGDG